MREQKDRLRKILEQKQQLSPSYQVVIQSPIRPPHAPLQTIDDSSPNKQRREMMHMVVDPSIKFNTCRNSSGSSSGANELLSKLSGNAKENTEVFDKREEESHLMLNNQNFTRIELIPVKQTSSPSQVTSPSKYQ